MSDPPDTPSPLTPEDQAMVHVLTERLVLATGFSNTLDIAMSPGVLGRLDDDVRRALELRLGLDRIAAGKPGRARSVADVASLMGGRGTADVDALIARALEGLQADA